VFAVGRARKAENRGGSLRHYTETSGYLLTAHLAFLEDDKHVEKLELSRDCDHEITSHNRIGVVAYQGCPALRPSSFPAGRRPRSSRPVLSHGSRRHEKAQLEIRLRRHSSLGQEAFSFAMRTINSRISPWRGGRPGRDLQPQNRWKPLRYQPIRASGLTITRALLQSNRRDHNTRLQRAASVSSWGLVYVLGRKPAAFAKTGSRLSKTLATD